MHYGDLLDTSDKRMDYDCEDQHKQDPIKEMTFKFKSAPNKGLNLANGADMVSGKTAGTWDFKHKSEIKYNCANNQYQTKIVASNKDFLINVEANPSNMNNADVQTTLIAEGKCTPQKEDWEGKLIAKVGGVKMGPVTSFSEVSNRIMSCLIFVILIARS